MIRTATMTPGHPDSSASCSIRGGYQWLPRVNDSGSFGSGSTPATSATLAPDPHQGSNTTALAVVCHSHVSTDQNAIFDDDDPLQSPYSTFVLTLLTASSSPFELLECPILPSGEDTTMPWLPSIATKPQVSGEDPLSFTPKLLLSSTVMVLSIIVPLAQHLHVLLPPPVLEF